MAESWLFQVVALMNTDDALLRFSEILSKSSMCLSSSFYAHFF